ncbi:MAG: hypothetical protein IJL22_02530 [Bacteroidales bacterium]|nr:hypothetical protein [Bacteroidales bacterium]
MKERYNSPQAMVIQLDGCMTPICISGEDFEIEVGTFDPESDTPQLLI